MLVKRKMKISGMTGGGIEGKTDQSKRKECRKGFEGREDRRRQAESVVQENGVVLGLKS